MYNEKTPVWLEKWSPGHTFNLADFFASRVVLYPGSGTDGQPVKFFGSRHAAHCFVYVDYGIPRNHVERELGASGHPFAGYYGVGRAEIRQGDLTPNGWVPHMRSERAFNGPLIPEAPYAFIEILQRKVDFGGDHGPKRLAILFICADGVAAYDALFCQSTSRAPFAVILQDHGWGGNWTKFGRGGGLEQLARRTGRLPQFLLVAENTEPWDGYSAVEGYAEGGGGMHNFVRQLWCRE